MAPTVGSTVRIVLIGQPAARALFASVLGVAPILPELLGAKGEPTITVATLDNPSAAGLSKVDWHQEFSRFTGVPHVSHPDVKAGRVSVAWVDTLLGAEQEDELGEFDPSSFFPAPIVAAPEVVEAVAIPAPVAVVEVPPVRQFAELEGVPGRLIVASEVLVAGKFVTLDKLKVGDHMEGLELTVTTLSHGDDGTLYIGTDPVKPATPEVPVVPAVEPVLVPGTHTGESPVTEPAAVVAAEPAAIVGEVIKPI